jgi:hypothetical protein
MRRRTFLLTACGAALAGEARAADPRLMVDGYVLLRIFEAAIEGHMAAMLRTLRVIAASKSADGATWKDVAPSLRQIVDLSPTSPVGWLATPDGAYSTTFDNAPALDNLKGRTYFAQAMGGKDVEGDPLISTVSGQRVIVVAAPVIRAGQVIGAVGVEVAARRVMEVVDSYYKLPPELYFIVLDDAGLIVLHTEHDRIFQTPDMAEPSMAAAVKRIIAEPHGTVAYRARGQARVAAFNRSDALGWHFMVVRDMR